MYYLRKKSKENLENLSEVLLLSPWISNCLVQPDGLTPDWEYSEKDDEDEDERCCDARAVPRAPFPCARSDAGRET